MKIVIDIPESIYETIKEEEVGNVVYKAIKNGTPHETVTEFADKCRECGKQRTGHWERHYIRPNVYADLCWHCSACGDKCGYNDANLFEYCPHCGARMESEEQE